MLSRLAKRGEQDAKRQRQLVDADTKWRQQDTKGLLGLALLELERAGSRKRGGPVAVPETGPLRHLVKTLEATEEGRTIVRMLNIKRYVPASDKSSDEQRSQDGIGPLLRHLYGGRRRERSTSTLARSSGKRPPQRRRSASKGSRASSSKSSVATFIPAPKGPS